MSRLPAFTSPATTRADDSTVSLRPQFLNFTAPLGQVVGDELVAPLSQVRAFGLCKLNYAGQAWFTTVACVALDHCHKGSAAFATAPPPPQQQLCVCSTTAATALSFSFYPAGPGRPQHHALLCIPGATVTRHSITLSLDAAGPGGPQHHALVERAGAEGAVRHSGELVSSI